MQESLSLQLAPNVSPNALLIESMLLAGSEGDASPSSIRRSSRKLYDRILLAFMAGEIFDIAVMNAFIAKAVISWVQSLNIVLK